jgi:hypothetical protein
MTRPALSLPLALALVLPFAATAQAPPAAARPYVTVSAPVVALTHVRVIDGTGAAPAEDRTIVIRDGVIASVGFGRSHRLLQYFPSRANSAPTRP